jgi:isopenicillin N synthase-like dioxygenase
VSSSIPLIDIAVWRDGDAATRAALAAQVDAALRDSGFLLVGNHGVPADLKERIRSQARRFFALPATEKAPYTTHVGGRGWLPPGREANSYYGQEADADRADLKESYTLGRDFATGDAGTDAKWFAPNVWPEQTPELAGLCAAWTDALRELYDDLLEMFALALGLDDDWFLQRTRVSPHTLNINRYPPLSQTGAPKDGQFRIAPHTDWGVITILDRQPGYGGLQVELADGGWTDAPYVDDAFTVNIGDLMARWTADRWRSTRHRVLPPSPDAPDEELISLILFLEADVDAVVAPIGVSGADAAAYPPVTVGEYLHERETAANVT